MITVGSALGALVFVGFSVGSDEGLLDGSFVGSTVAAVGSSEGILVGDVEGSSDVAVGEVVASVGDILGAVDGLFVELLGALVVGCCDISA